MVSIFCIYNCKLTLNLLTFNCCVPADFYTVKTGVLQLHCIERSQCREKLTLQPGNHDTARSVNDITLISVLVTLSVA